MSDEKKGSPKVLNLDRLFEAHEDGLWRDLSTGGRLKMLYQPFEQGRKLSALEEAYRKEHNLAPDAPIPPEVSKDHQSGLLVSVITDFDGSSFVLDGGPVQDRDAEGKVHAENLDRVMTALLSLPETRSACFVALNTIGTEIARAQEAEEKNSSTPSPTN